MEAKYYTPELEEFHKEFQFEWFQNDWEKETFAVTTDDDLEIIDDEIREGKIRVKALDKEDIESFGFIKDHLDIENYTSKSGNFKIKIKDQPRKNGDISLELYSYDSINLEKLIFKGEIKNKSELKKELKKAAILKK